MNKLQKTLMSGAIIATLAIGSVGAAFAQDDAETTESTILCAPAEMAAPNFLERQEERQSWWEQLGLTAEDVQAYLDESENNTLETLRDEYTDELEALQAERQAEREAEKAEREAELISCIEDAVTNGDLTQEQADALIEAIQADSVRDVLNSDLFADSDVQLFPRGERGDRDGKHEGRGNGGRDGRNGRGGAPNAPEGDAGLNTNPEAQG